METFSWSKEFLRQLSILPTEPGSVAIDTWCVLALVILLYVKYISRQSPKSLVESAERERYVQSVSQEVLRRVVSMESSAPAGSEGSGTDLAVDAAQLDRLRTLINSGEKIKAIKELRSFTRLGLAESKELVERIQEALPK